jgi:hypothetical protein
MQRPTAPLIGRHSQAPLIGRHCQAPTKLWVKLSGSSLCGSRSFPQSVQVANTLHAYVRQNGEPRFWARFKAQQTVTGFIQTFVHTRDVPVKALQYY